jgi:hypothetical protein
MFLNKRIFKFIIKKTMTHVSHWFFVTLVITLHENSRNCFLCGISIYHKFFLKVRFHQNQRRDDCFRDPYKSIFDIICPRKRTILLKKIMNWFDHHSKIWKKPTDEVNNTHKILNLLLGSGSRQIKDSSNPFMINAYS